MAKDLRYLAKRMNTYGKGVVVATNEISKEMARLTTYNLIINTPIDVGTARSNWFLSLGGFFIGTRRRAFNAFPSRWRPPYGKGGGFNDKTNLVGSMQKAMAILRTREVGEIVVISNPLPYISRLNTGYSNQAPSGFVQRAIGTATKDFRKIVREKFNAEFSK